MIKSISIADVASYNKAGIKIDELKKINFIYGANGTGKTTITKLLSNNTLVEFEKSLLIWEGDIELPVLVYNKDFRERSFGKGNFDGVFTLGEAPIEQKEAIEKMLSNLKEFEKQGIQKKSTLESLKKQKLEIDDRFIETVWVDVYKQYETVFKDAFTGVMRKKENFKDKLLDQANNSATLTTFEDLKTRALTVFGTPPIELQSITQIDYSRLLEIEVNKIWTKKIIGKSDIEISKLIQHLNINDWVHEGRNYLRDNSVCPFCQKETITKDFRDQINGYFDQSFEEDIQHIKSLASEYKHTLNDLLNLVDVIVEKEKVNSNSKLNREKFESFSKTVAIQLRENEGIIKSKNKEPSRSLSLNPLKDQLNSLSVLIDEANKKIKEHNKIVKDFTSEKMNLTTLIWRFLFESYKATIKQYMVDSKNKQKGIDAVEQQVEDLRKEYQVLNKKIKEANRNVTSIQPSVDEINNTLKAHGFLNFEIISSSEDKNQYRIQREDGSVAKSTLSEGEITFITFLYFLQRAKGGLTEDSISDERILIIDDPISSLDSNVLFIVSTLIKQILKDVKENQGVIRQVLILTHNVYFHKEVSYISGKPKEDKDTSFWILRKRNKISTIQSYSMENPIHNSYELLWKELKNQNQLDSITIHNTMRRIIETYFKILGDYHYDDLIESFKDSPEEKEICRSMLCWINDGSHTIPDDLFIQSHDDINTKYFEVFEKIFINTKQHEHFKMMYPSFEEKIVSIK